MSRLISRKPTYRDRLRQAARENDGFVTPTIAADYGVPKVELRKLAQRGAFEKVHRGVYWDPLYPADEHTEIRGILRSLGNEAYLAEDSVLALFDLANVNPRVITIASPQRHQRELPDNIRVIKPKRAEDIHLYKGIPCQPLVTAFEDAAPGIMRERLVAAIRKAREEGLLLRREYRQLMEKFSDEDL